MSTVLILAKNRKFQGVFTQRKILWGFLEESEGKEKTVRLDEIESLVIQSDDGKIESSTGSGRRFTTMTYPHLCSIMRDHSRVAIHDANSFEPLYGIWQTEPNVPYEENAEIDEKEAIDEKIEEC